MTSRAEIHKPFFTLVTGLAACRNQSQIHETGAGEKEIGLFKRQPPDKVGDSCLKAHLNISVQAEVFIRKERESRTKRSKGGDLQFIYGQASTVRSDKNLTVGQAMIWCTSPRLYIDLLYGRRSANLPELA